MRVNDLVLVNGNLMRLFGQTPLNSVFDLPPIKVVGKGDAKRGNDDQFDFEFRLNSSTDAEWRDLFCSAYDLRCVSFSGDLMRIRSRESELREIYDKTRAHIDKINSQYIERRDGWIAAVKKRDAGRLVMEERKKSEDVSVPESFRDFNV